MDPVSPPGWKADQREFAEWSDGYTSETSLSQSSSPTFTDVDEDEDDIVGHVKTYEYYKLVQVKKVYKVILEEEDLIK
jgi:hypothetical protein